MEKETHLQNYPLMGYVSSWEGMSVQNRFPRIQLWTRSTAFHFEAINLVHAMKNLTSISTARLLRFHVLNTCSTNWPRQPTPPNRYECKTNPKNQPSYSWPIDRSKFSKEFHRYKLYIPTSEQRFLELRKLMQSVMILNGLCLLPMFICIVDILAKPLKALRPYPQNQNHPGHYREFLLHGVHAHATPSGPVGHDQRKVPEIWKHQSPSLAHWDAWWEPNRCKSRQTMH